MTLIRKQAGGNENIDATHQLAWKELRRAL